MLRDKGMSVAELSRISGVSHHTIHSLLKRPSASMNAESARSLLVALDALDDFLTDPKTIPLVGKVGAGAKVPEFNAYPDGGGPKILCPPGITPSEGIAAVEIEGDSMEPMYSEGDMLIYVRDAVDRVSSEIIGQRCICVDSDNMGWIKQIKPGSEPGLFHLISMNPGATTRWDVQLLWAARVRLHWPADLTKTV